MVVGTRPDANLSPCALRSIIISAVTEERRRPLLRVADIEFGGSLEDVGGGVIRSRTPCGIEQRWVACRLTPETVLALLDDAGPDGIPADAMHARLTYDHDLAVSVLSITAERREFEGRLDAVAADVAASCFAAELIQGATGVSWSPR